MTISEPSPPPRPLTWHLRYRVLAAKPVSLLLFICLVIIVVCIVTGSFGYREWSRIHRLKRVGQSTQAQVIDIRDERPYGQRGAASSYVYFKFYPLHTESSEPVEDKRLHSLFDKPLKLDSRLEVVYDPENPKDFFCPETDDRSLAGYLRVQIVFLFAVVLLLLLAGFRYFRLLRIARSAPAQLGRIADIRSSAQGAFSRLVVITFGLGETTLVIKRVLPFGLVQRFSVGDSVWLLVPPARPRRAIVAAAFL